jgi:hypothetical protein
MLQKKSMFAAGVCALAIVGASTGTAFAGEKTGNGEDTQGPAHANSICVFSGQNDNPDEAFPEDGRTQSYGQLVRKGQKDFFPSPGDACNPSGQP